MIDEISPSRAVIVLDIANECIWAELSLDHECERMCDDNYTNEYFWDEYTPIIKSMKGVDEDGEYYLMPSDTAEIIRKRLDCDEFYTAYQGCFDDDFAWGQRTSHYYYTRQ